MLTAQHTEKFQNLYKAHFGKEISPEEAYEKGVKLIRLIELIYTPMTETEYSLVQKRRKQIQSDSY